MELKTSPKIKFTEILLDYGPEVLVAFATDESERKLFAVALGKTDELNDPYLIVHVGDEMARRIKSRMVDALSAMLTPATREWHVVNFSGEIGDVVKTYNSPEEIPNGYLPDPELYV